MSPRLLWHTAHASQTRLLGSCGRQSPLLASTSRSIKKTRLLLHIYHSISARRDYYQSPANHSASPCIHSILARHCCCWLERAHKARAYGRHLITGCIVWQYCHGRHRRDDRWVAPVEDRRLLGNQGSWRRQEHQVQHIQRRRAYLVHRVLSLRCR